MIVLPLREDFSPGGAGAISLVVRRMALGSPGCVVVGAPRAETFPGISYVPVRSALGVLRVVARLRPEVVEVHQQPRLAIALSRLFPAARVLLFLHNDPRTMRGLRSAFGRWLARRWLHRVVCVSAYLAARFGAGASVLWNPITLAELPEPAALRERTVLFAGRMTADKAPDVFVAACAKALPRMPGWRAVMIGGDRFGPESPETAFVAKVRVAAREAGVAFDGVRTHAQVMAAMARAAIVVVPSRWAEPFGMTALEAMASGVALVTTGTGGLAEVAGDVGVRVAVDDADGLAEAMVQLAEDAAERERLGRLGMARAGLFDTSVILPRLERLRAALD